MKILSRFLIVVALLTALGYGSYAFGRYVLSERLFGNAVVPNSSSGVTVASSPEDVMPPVTRKTTIRGGKPRVDIEVLPASEAGPGPEPPSIENLRSSTESRDFSERAPGGTGVVKPETTSDGTRTFSRSDKNDVIGNADGSTYEDADRRRRRRRNREREKEEAEKAAAAAAAADTARAETAIIAGSDASTGAGPAGRSEMTASPRRERVVSSDSGSESGKQPGKRRRENSPPAEPAPRPSRSSSSSKAVRRENARSTSEPQRRTVESPVPKAEGGGESPVPLPG